MRTPFSLSGHLRLQLTPDCTRVFDRQVLTVACSPATVPALRGRPPFARRLRPFGFDIIASRVHLLKADAAEMHPFDAEAETEQAA